MFLSMGLLTRFVEIAHPISLLFKDSVHGNIYDHVYVTLRLICRVVWKKKHLIPDKRSRFYIQPWKSSAGTAPLSRTDILKPTHTLRKRHCSKKKKSNTSSLLAVNDKRVFVCVHQRERRINPEFGTDSLAQFDNPLLQVTLWFEVRMRSSSPEELISQRKSGILLSHTKTQQKDTVITSILHTV